MTHEQRRAANAQRLQKIYPALRPKVAAVLSDLEGKGWQPVIDAQVYRTPAQQARLRAEGKSKVSYSFHTVTGPNGEPQSLAADIVDVRYGWNPPKHFWLQLASSAEAHGMSSGIRWGLPTAKRTIINTLIKLKKWDAQYVLGWDPAHIECTGITLSQAKAGKRPK